MPQSSPQLEQISAGDVHTRLKNIEETLYDPDKGIFSRISSIQTKLESGLTKVQSLFEKVDKTLEDISRWKHEDKTDIKIAEIDLKLSGSNLQTDYVKRITERDEQRIIQLDQKVALLEDRLISRTKEVSDLQANYGKLFWAVMTFATSGLAKFIWDALKKLTANI